jgi:hypothetical protein
MSQPARPSVLRPSDLEKVGKALFGEEWRSKLGRTPGLSPSTIKMMSLGHRPIHADAVRILIDLCTKRSDAIVTLRRVLEEKLQKETDR